jgi:3-carboxy-cis,cis-muconate cycloisomerase
MPASPADSPLYRALFGDDEAARLFTDSAEIRAMLLVEGALARVQGVAGVIPADAAAFIDRAAQEVQIDPAALAAETARNGVPVPALLAAFRKAANAPDLMQHVHWGATSQDIIDTAIALRLRRLFDLWQTRLDALLARLATLAQDHAETPMAARTYGQYATPTSFGAVVASWGWPLIGWRDDLPSLRHHLQRVSLSGAAGTSAALGPNAPALRAALAKALDLHDPGHSWHSDRSGIARLAGFAAGLAGSLGKTGEDLLLLTQSGISEVALGTGGASSTMPQKQNPVAPSALVALSRQVVALASTLQGAGLHRQQRDGAAWFTEWLSLPQLCLSTSRALSLAIEIAETLVPDPTALSRPLTEGAGLIHAEALAFALARTLPRTEAQSIVTEMCDVAQRTGTSLVQQASLRFPATDWNSLIVTTGLGSAPSEARAFAKQARTQAIDRRDPD